MADLVPDLQHILFWMSNAIELLYFTQQACPLYVQSLEDELDVTGTAGAGRVCRRHAGPTAGSCWGCCVLRVQGPHEARASGAASRGLWPTHCTVGPPDFPHSPRVQPWETQGCVGALQA